MKKFGPRNPTPRKNRHPRKGKKSKLRKNAAGFLNPRGMLETLMCLSIGEFFRPLVRQVIKSNSASKKTEPADSSTSQQKENA